MPTATSNQFPMANTAYVRLSLMDVFLVVVMDALARKVIGWNVAPPLAAIHDDT